MGASNCTLLSFYPREMKDFVYREICIIMFTVGLYQPKMWEWGQSWDGNVHPQVKIQTNLGMFIFIQWNATQQWKATDCWYFQHHGLAFKAWWVRWVKYKNVSTVQFPTYEAQEQANQLWCWKSAKWLFGQWLPERSMKKSRMLEISCILIGMVCTFVRTHCTAQLSTVHLQCINLTSKQNV